ncbi:hypothetical protein RQP46_002933 [Phenoliferia psychrophenolica]
MISTFAADMQRLALLTGPYLAQLESLSPRCSTTETTRPPLTLPLPYPEVVPIDQDLERHGCTRSTSAGLAELFRRGVEELRMEARQGAAQTWEVVSAEEPHSVSLDAYRIGIETQYTRTFLEQVARMKADLFAEVDEARAAIEREESEREDARDAIFGRVKGTHSETQINILNKFLNERLASGKEAFFKPAERRLISQATGLSDQQIITWFSNYRNRGSKLAKRLKATAACFAGGRHSPYPTPRRPGSKSASEQQTHSMRNFSNSSASSLDSTISYGSTVSFVSCNPQPSPSPSSSLPLPPPPPPPSAYPATAAIAKWTSPPQLVAPPSYATPPPAPTQSLAPPPFISPHLDNDVFSDWDSFYSSSPSPSIHDSDLVLEPVSSEELDRFSQLLDADTIASPTAPNSFPLLTSSTPAPTPTPASRPYVLLLQQPNPLADLLPVHPHEPAQHAWFPTPTNPILDTIGQMSFSDEDYHLADALGVETGRGALRLPIDAAASVAGDTEMTGWD